MEVRTRVHSTKSGHRRYTVQGYEYKPPPQRALGTLPTSNPSNLDLLGSSPDSLCSNINRRFRARFDGFLHPYLYVKLQRVRARCVARSLVRLFARSLTRSFVARAVMHVFIVLSVCSVVLLLL